MLVLVCCTRGLAGTWNSHQGRIMGGEGGLGVVFVGGVDRGREGERGGGGGGVMLMLVVVVVVVVTEVVCCT